MCYITSNQATLIGAFGSPALGAVAGGAVSYFVARYTVKHSANYSGQIEAINETLRSLAVIQEQHYAQSVVDEKERHEESERRAEAARWKPQVQIVSKAEGVEQVNKLIFKDQANFYLTEASLISSAGAKLVDYPVAAGAPTGFSVPITQESLNKLTAIDEQFTSTSNFNGATGYTAKREKDGASYTGEIRFHGKLALRGNACFYELSG